MDEWRINFCQNLHHLRQVHNLTQVEMAAIVGVSVATYRKMEHCDPKMRILSSQLYRIREHFDICPDDIFHQNWRKMLEERRRGELCSPEQIAQA